MHIDPAEKNAQPSSSTAPTPCKQTIKTQSLFGMEFSCLPLLDMADFLCQPMPNIPHGKLQTLYTANIDHLGNWGQNTEFLNAYKNAHYRTIDGAPVALWAKLRGRTAIKRVPGSDLFTAIMPKLSPAHHRVFFICPTIEVGDHLRLWLISHGFAQDNIACSCPDFGFENDPKETALLLQEILSHSPSHIFMGVGSPKSEIWLEQSLKPAYKDAQKTQNCYALAIGASLEFFTGHVKRAPHWMRKFGLEWLHRLFSDPKRLAKRYIVGSWRALKIFYKDLTGQAL